MTIGPRPNCLGRCRHFKGKSVDEENLKMRYFCAAFPNGIPEDIVLGLVSHTTEYPGDNGIRFAPLEGGEKGDG